MIRTQLQAWCLDHRNAHQSLREQFAVAPHTVSARLQALRASTGATEALVVSTCNRVLWVTAGTQTPLPFSQAGARFESVDAARHLARVATGLESLVIGEPQILGQVKDAWQMSRSAGMSGPELEFLMPRLLGIAKRVRKESGLGQGATSVAHAGLDHAMELFGRTAPRVLVIGAGKMASIAVRQARHRGASAIHVANRTYSTALALGNAYGACPVAYQQIYSLISAGTFDIVICACSAPHPILSPAHVAAAAESPLIVVDLALPRNVEPAVGQCPGVRLVDIDSLSETLAHGREMRAAAGHRAEPFFDRHFSDFLSRWRDHSSVARFEEASIRGERIREEEWNRIVHRLSGLDDASLAVVGSMVRRVSRRFMHEVFTGIRAAGIHPEVSDPIDTQPFV